MFDSMHPLPGPHTATATRDLRADRQQGPAHAPRPDTPDWSHNSLASLLAPEDILLDLDATTREHAFAAIARLIGARYGLREAEVIAGLAEREKLGSTALGQGVAIPHARLKGLTHVIAVFARLRAAVPLDAPDGKPVSTLLVLLVPEGATDAHLELLAQAASMFCDRPLRDRLGACATASEILATLAGWRST